MRKYLLLLIGITLFYSSFSQTNPDTLTANITKEDLLTLSKKQRTAGIVLGTAGTVLITIAFSMTLSNLNNLFEPGEYRDNSTAIDVLSVLGTAALASGIYVLIRSRINKRKALSMGFIIQPLLGDPFSNVHKAHFPAAHLQIHF